MSFYQKFCESRRSPSTSHTIFLQDSIHQCSSESRVPVFLFPLSDVVIIGILVIVLWTCNRAYRQTRRAREDIFELHHKINTALRLIESAHSIFVYPAVDLDPDQDLPLYRLVPENSHIRNQQVIGLH